MKLYHHIVAIGLLALLAMASWSCSSQEDEPPASASIIDEWLSHRLSELEIGYMGPDKDKISYVAQIWFSSNHVRYPVRTVRLHTNGTKRYFSMSVFYYELNQAAYDPRGDEQLYPFNSVVYLDQICIDEKGNSITDPAEIQKILSYPYVYIPKYEEDATADWCAEGFETDFVRYRKNEPQSYLSEENNSWIRTNLPGVYENAFKEYGENLMAISASFLYDKETDTRYDDVVQLTVLAAVAPHWSVRYDNTYYVKSDKGYVEVTKDEFLAASAAKFKSPEKFEQNGYYFFGGNEPGVWYDQFPYLQRLDNTYWKEWEASGRRLSYI